VIHSSLRGAEGDEAISAVQGHGRDCFGALRTLAMTLNRHTFDTSNVEGANSSSTPTCVDQTCSWHIG